MAQADYKAPDGKLIRVSLEEKNGVIGSIRITGDFFMHPEEFITEMERHLRGRRVDEIAESIAGLAGERGVRMVGVSPADLQKAAEKAQAAHGATGSG